MAKIPYYFKVDDVDPLKALVIRVRMLDAIVRLMNDHAVILDDPDFLFELEKRVRKELKESCT